jgi:predicted  nucleic acid-binding Zn-ribbon protein
MPQVLNLQPNEVSPAGDEVSRLKRQVERQEDEHQDYQRRTKILSVVLGALIVTLVGILCTIYPTLRDAKMGLVELFTLRNITNTLTERTAAVEASLNKMKSDLPALSNRVDKVQANMKANLQAARNQMNRSLHVMESRVSGLESNQRESSDRVNQLQDQISGLQREITVLREQASAAAAQKRQEEQSQQEPAASPGTQD